MQVVPAGPQSPVAASHPLVVPILGHWEGPQGQCSYFNLSVFSVPLLLWFWKRAPQFHSHHHGGFSVHMIGRKGV